MTARTDAALIAAALLGTGALVGIGVQGAAGTATPAVTVTATHTARVTVTATVRVTERATRSHSRGPSPASLPTSRTTSEGARGGLPSGAVRGSDYKTYARALVDADQWPCLDKLWTRESNWRADAVNGSHFGIPQMRGLAHDTGWQRQITRGLSYIDHRYGGSACAALAHSNRNGWY